MADEYVSRHHGDCEYRAPGVCRGDGSKFWLANKRWVEGAAPHHSKLERAILSQLHFDLSKIHNYCEDRGHWKAECPVKSSAKCGKVKPVALAASIKCVSAVSSPWVISPCEQMDTSGECSLDQSGSLSFVTDSHVSLV